MTATIEKTVTRSQGVLGQEAILAEARALVALAGPLILTQLAQMAVFTTDIMLLGRYGRTALAAAAIGNTLYFATWLLGSGAAFAVSPMIAHTLGGNPNDRRGVRLSVRMGLWAVLIIGAPLVAALWWVKPLLLAAHQDPLLAEGASQFVRAVSFGLPFSLGFLVLRSFASSVGQPRPAMYVMAATVVLNGVAGYALIFGALGAPRLGIVGSGMAGALSQIFCFLAMAAVVWATPSLRRYRIWRRFGRPAWDSLMELIRLGVPIALSLMFEAMLFNIMTLVMGSFGAVPLAAHQIALNVASITFMVPLGLGMAATIRVGLAAGAGNFAGVRRAGLTALGAGTAFILICAAVMVLAGPQIAALYLGGRSPADLAVIATAALFLKVAAAFQVFDASQVVAMQTLRGLKDTRVPMIIAGAAYWLVGAPICLVLAFGAHLQGLGIWIGLALGLAAASGALISRFLLMTDRRARG